MDYDDEARKQGDSMFIVWTRNMKKHSLDLLAARLARTHCNETPTEAAYYAEGAFNTCYRVEFQSHADVLVRFPALGKSNFCKEKLEDEVVVMKYIAQNTSIPVPKVLGSGSCVVGPYMVIEFIEGKLLSSYLKVLASSSAVAGSVPNIDISILKKAYRGMAKIMLELLKCQFSRIGAVTTSNEPGNKVWSIGKRAVTLNMNELVGLANFPPKELPTDTFSTESAYLVSLAEDHMNHLRYQRNDAVTDEADCRRKYIARCLFRRIARQPFVAYENGPFYLFCDDFRPSNVIVDEDLNVRGVIDWEFCYSAPAIFTYASPWWLLLCRPEDWEGDLDDFSDHYFPRQEIFLEVLRECEEEAIKEGTSPQLQPLRLSELMEASLRIGWFWICLAARSSYAFDTIYWRFIDWKYYGEFTSVEDRIKYLSEEEQDNLEEFVHSKMQQAKERKLDEHRTLDEMLNS